VGLRSVPAIAPLPPVYTTFQWEFRGRTTAQLHGGIHYAKSIEAGFLQGRKVADNIERTLKFLK